MAAEDEGRTEEASEYKLEKARKEGRVAKSQEVSGALILILCVVVLILIGSWLLSQFTGVYRFYFERCTQKDINDPDFVIAFFNVFIKCVLPTSIVSFIAAIAGNIIQTKGFIFSWKPVTPNFSKIVPKFGEYFKKTIFSSQGLFNVGKSILKVIIICVIAFFLIKKDIFELLMIISNGQIYSSVGKIAGMCAQILLIVSVLFLAISIPDYFVQRHNFMEEMKMTKQEQKEEYKEMEGDPEVKGRLKQMQQQLLSQDVRKAVSESDVVITNPTHFAVALKYDQEKADSPMVNAKGEDEMAQTIKRLASENNIPIVENRPVARELYTNLQVGDIIPPIYFKTIVAIYSQLDKFKRK